MPLSLQTHCQHQQQHHTACLIYTISSHISARIHWDHLEIMLIPRYLTTHWMTYCINTARIHWDHLEIMLTPRYLTTHWMTHCINTARIHWDHLEIMLTPRYLTTHWMTYCINTARIHWDHLEIMLTPQYLTTHWMTYCINTKAGYKATKEKLGYTEIILIIINLTPIPIWLP